MYNNSTKKQLRQKVQVHSDGTREYWRDVPNFRGCYRVSYLGRVKSLPRFVVGKDGRKMRIAKKILNPAKHGSYGHVYVSLWKNGRNKPMLVHQIVLTAFVGPCLVGKECRHLNSRGWDNRLRNICWGTHKENEKDKISNGTSNRGSNNGQAKLTEADVKKMLKMKTEGYTPKQIAEKFGSPVTTIRGILNRTRWRYLTNKSND